MLRLAAAAASQQHSGILIIRTRSCSLTSLTLSLSLSHTHTHLTLSLSRTVCVCALFQHHQADEEALSYLTDLKYSSSLGGGKKGFQLAFTFSPNPFFEDTILTKT